MKAKSFLMFCLVIMISSCYKEAVLEIQRDFIGNYSGEFACEGPLSEEEESSFYLNITKLDDTNYELQLSYEIILRSELINSELVIPEQLINEGQTADVMTFRGVIRQEEDSSYRFIFSHQVDSEGWSECDIILIKF